MQVAEKWDNSLTRELARVLSEMRIDRTKREALREMAFLVLPSLSVAILGPSIPRLISSLGS